MFAKEATDKGLIFKIYKQLNNNNNNNNNKSIANDLFHSKKLDTF